jgi:hypothetical protein
MNTEKGSGMFEQLATKLSELGSHHQMAFTIVITFSVICMSWAVERIFDHYIFTTKPLHGYLAVIFIALFLLWLTQHVILHVA